MTTNGDVFGRKSEIEPMMKQKSVTYEPVFSSDLFSSDFGNKNANKSSERDDFSTDILRFFNVASEVDRFDAQEALTLLRKSRKSENNLKTFFKVRKNNKIKTNLKKGDILFKTSPLSEYRYC